MLKQLSILLQKILQIDVMNWSARHNLGDNFK